MGVYNHLGGKDGLWSRVLIRGFDGLTAGMTALAGLPPDQRLRACGRAYRQFASENPAVYQLMFGAGKAKARVDVLDDVHPHAEAAFGALVAAVVTTQHAGLVMAGDPFDLAMRIWSAVHGAMSLELAGSGPPNEDSAGTYERIIDMIEAGLAPPATSVNAANHSHAVRPLGGPRRARSRTLALDRVSERWRLRLGRWLGVRTRFWSWWLRGSGGGGGSGGWSGAVVCGRVWSVQVVMPVVSSRVTVQSPECLSRWWRRHSDIRFACGGLVAGCEGFDVVEVVVAGCAAAAGEAAVHVAGDDGAGHVRGWAVGSRSGRGDEAVVVGEQDPPLGGGVGGDAPGHGGGDRAVPVQFGGLGVQAHEGGRGDGDLDAGALPVRLDQVRIGQHAGAQHRPGRRRGADPRSGCRRLCRGWWRRRPRPARRSRWPHPRRRGRRRQSAMPCSLGERDHPPLTDRVGVGVLLLGRGRDPQHRPLHDARNWVRVCSAARSTTSASTTAPTRGSTSGWPRPGRSRAAARCPRPATVRGWPGRRPTRSEAVGHPVAHRPGRHPQRGRDLVTGEPVLRPVTSVQRGQQFRGAGLQQPDVPFHRDEGVDLTVHVQHRRGQHVQHLDQRRVTGPVGPGRRRSRSGTTSASTTFGGSTHRRGVT